MLSENLSISFWKDSLESLSKLVAFEYFKIIYLNIWGFKLTFNEQKKLKIDPNSKKEL